MPQIGSVGSLLFYVYADDHNPPHVHAIYGDDTALLVLATGALLAGSLNAAQLRSARAWLQENRAVAEAAWQRLNP